MTISDREKEILEFWRKNKTFQKSLDKTKDKKDYIFYDGPPFATGTPHYGHLLVSIIKDAFPRFFTMKGNFVKRVWGWDCHGLPVENIAEKELKINSKDEIEKMGVKKFNSFCRSKVLAFADEWEKDINRVGRWVDFKGGYKTMDNSYIESVWWAFKQLYEKGYLYEGEKILMYCPRCSTPLAKSEIAMDNSYKIVKDLTVTVKFAMKNEKNTYAIAWTTTPWTLPSNLALTVNPNLIYAYVKDNNDGNTYIMAKDLISNFYKSKSEYAIIKEIKGQKLEGEEFEPLFPYFKDTPNAFKFLLGDFVTSEEGTGIVHTAPAFGEEDNAICRKYKIPMVQPVDENGKFTDEVKDYAGEFIHDTNEKIVIDLKTADKAIMSRKIDHEYPFCYRCDTKLMYRALPAWFVDIQKIKKKLLKLNTKINWIPDFLKEGRMQHNITTAPDWNITRNRYWATAIPIWKSKSGKIKVIGSIEELKKFAINLPKGKIDLHKDYLDEIKLKVDGEEYIRIPEVLDCWFESGAMPFAQFHYPFENKEFFDKNFPAQFVTEYIGQTRAWFYYMMTLSAILFDKIPFENVLTTGTILAENGSKMSKSKKNFADPNIIIEKYGADALRFYLLTSPVMGADNFNFSEKGMEEIYKKVMVLLYNVNNFYSMYDEKLDSENTNSKNIMDRWIVSRLNESIESVSKYMEEYNTIKTCSELRTFIDDLSTWYVRNSRDRFNLNNKDARETLKFVLANLSKIIAPIIPFVAETIWQTIHTKKDSVHLTDWPKVNLKNIDNKLIEDMKLVREIVSLGLRERDQNKVSLKWPLSKVKVSSDIKIDNKLKDIIKQELNVKEIEFIKGIDIKVELDFKMTPELESEGYSREVTRQIQAYRKKLGLTKDQKVQTYLIVEDKFGKIFEKQKKEIKEKTNSVLLKIENVTTLKETFKNKIAFRIKEQSGEIAIVID